MSKRYGYPGKPLWVDPISEWVPEYGHLMTMEDFVSACMSGGFINSDGFGCYATKDLMTSIEVKPSDVRRREAFVNTYSHVVWFNR